MEKVNLLILRHLKNEYIDQISNFDCRINVADQSDPDKLGNYLPIVNEEILNDYKKAEIVLAYRTPENLLELAPNLKWLQLSSAGFEHLEKSVIKSHIKITNSLSIHGIAMAEHIVMLMLMFTRRALDLIAWKNQRQWTTFIPGELRGKTLGIIGLGHIGSEVANIAKAFGLKIMATDIVFPKLTKGVAGMEATYPPYLMKEMLSKSDFVAIAVPQNEKTQGLIGESELRSMKKSAYIINVSRGPIVDEKALLGALEKGWIAGAGLDVFETEPLPVDSRFWDFPNVIISPHNAGVSEQHDQRLTDLFCENISRYFNNESLLNVVN